MPDTSPTDVQTLYNAPQLFSCNGSFCGGNVPEQFFGSPIPSQSGPNIPRSLELRGHYSDGDGDIGVLTAVAAMIGFLPVAARPATVLARLDFTSGRDLGRATGADLDPRFLFTVSGLNVLGLVTLAIDGPTRTCPARPSRARPPVCPSDRSRSTAAPSPDRSPTSDCRRRSARRSVTTRGVLPPCRVAQNGTSRSTAP